MASIQLKTVLFGADPKGKGQHGGQREYRAPLHQARSIADILAESLDLWIPKTPVGLKMQVFAPFVRSSSFPR
jgi:hypothetical protein